MKSCTIIPRWTLPLLVLLRFFHGLLDPINPYHLLQAPRARDASNRLLIALALGFCHDQGTPVVAFPLSELPLGLLKFELEVADT